MKIEKLFLFLFKNIMDFFYTGTEEIPENTTILRCNHNQLTSLTALPGGLKELYCSYNQLTSLPELPVGLQRLNCNHNQLTSLPELPAGLQELYCQNNQLTSLPALSESLQKLYCNDNTLLTIIKNLQAKNKEIQQLRKENKDLKEQLRLVPGGELYFEAMEHYKGMLEKQLK